MYKTILCCLCGLLEVSFKGGAQSGTYIPGSEYLRDKLDLYFIYVDLIKRRLLTTGSVVFKVNTSR